MSTKRGRKKAPPKQQVLQQQEPAEDIPDPSTVSKPTAPPSPIIAIAHRALSPVVLAAKAVTAAAATAAAAALPSIPEASAVAGSGLELDQDVVTTPKSQTVTPSNLSPVAVGKQQLDASDALFDGNYAVKQQNGGAQQGSDQDAAEFNNTSIQSSDRVQQALHAMQTLCLRQLSVVIAGLLLAMLVLQAVSLRSQQVSIQQQQQQLASQSLSVQSLQEQLDQALQQLRTLPDMQQLQDSTASCKQGVNHLASTQSVLNSSVETVAESLQVLAANVSNLIERSQSSSLDLSTLAAAAGADGLLAEMSGSNDNTNAAKSETTMQSLLKQVLQRHQLLEQEVAKDHEALAALPTAVAKQVEQQVAAKLLPHNVALASCGAHIAYATPFNVCAAAACRPTGTAKSWVKHWVAAALQPLLTASSHGSMQQPQQQRYAAADDIILGPAGQSMQRCVSMSLSSGAPAVLEIQLPGMVAIDSVAIHHPGWSHNKATASNAAAAVAQQIGSNTSSYSAGLSHHAAPAETWVALVNSSSCSTGACSKAAHAARIAGSNATIAYSAASNSRNSSSSSMLASGVHGQQQLVHFAAGNYSRGRAIWQVPESLGNGPVVADRVVLQVMSSLSKGLCLHRISVHGTPQDPFYFC